MHVKNGRCTPMSAFDMGLVYNKIVRENWSKVMEKIKTFFDRFSQLINNHNRRKALAYVRVRKD